MTDAGERVHARLFVPGTPDGLDAWRRALAPRGLELHEDALRGAGLPSPIEVEWVENPRDGSFGHAFSFGTATAAEQAAIDAAGGALVLYLRVDLHRERQAIAALGHALASCGALAVRVEESRLGYPIRRWLELVDGDDPLSLYRAVVVVLEGERDVATCGMHVFSLPDAQVALEDGTDRNAANALLGALNVFQLAEDPLLLSGHTFAPDAETPRRVLHRWPDATYSAGHVCHNPFGVWRLGPPGGTAESSPELAFVFMPALVVLLTAEERKAGRPLTREEVERITAGAIVMTVEHRRAQALERSRGYADLDPRRAWEQWQIARRGLEGE